MVVRHPACILCVSLLAAGLQPATARGLPRFVFGGSSAGKVSGATAQSRDRASALRRRATGLRLDEEGQSCSVRMKNGCRGVWGLKAVTRSMKQASDLRGGALASDDSEEDLDEFDDDDDLDDGMMDEEDFGEANFFDRLKQDWKKTPIITRTFFQISIGLAVFTAFFNGNQWPNALLLDWEPTIFKLQLWRLVTPFLYLGPLGVNFLLTTHFSWTYMSQLEKLHYREPHTFVMLLAFGMTSLVLLTLMTGGDINSSFTLGHSLSCFLVMVWSRKFAGTKVNVLDMFELSTELLPYFFVAQTLMMEGVVPWVDLSGLLIGYAWQTLSLKGLLQAPKPLVNLFRNNAFLRAEYARAGKEYGQEMPLHDDEDAVPPPEVPSEETPAMEEQTGGEKRGRGVAAEAARKAATERGAGVGKRGKAPVPELASEEEETEEEETEEEETGEEETEEEEIGEEDEESSDGMEERERDAADEDGGEYGSDDEAGETDSVDLEVEEGEEGGVESLFGEDEQLEDLEELDEEMESMLGDFDDDDFGDDELSGSYDGSREEEAESDED